MEQPLKFLPMTTFHESRWLKDVPLKAKYAPLKNDTVTDVAIVGGGIAGLLTAYYLNEAGKQVAVLEKNSVASGETAYTTAFLTMVFDYYLYELVRKYSKEDAKRVWRSGLEAIDEVERIAKKEKIDCDFQRCSAYIYALDSRGFKMLEKEYKLERELGFDVKLHKPETLPFSNQGVLEVKGQAKFHPLKFLVPLVEKMAERGVQFYEETEVRDYEGKEPFELCTDHATLKAQQVVVATNMPHLGDMQVVTRLTPYQSYIVELELKEMPLKEGIYWDTENPYQYFRVDGKRLILGGMDHATGKGKDEDYYAKLEEYFQGLFPEMSYTVLSRWSGEVLESIDHLPFIGPLVSNKDILVATGFAGNGMTMGPLSGRINADHILGRKNPYAELYTVARAKAGLHFMARGFEYVWHMIKDRLARHPEPRLAKGEGTIVDGAEGKEALFKDEKGKLHRMSAVCPHMKCIVKWNGLEKTWDCPCHGSRFAATGELMAGPARTPLVQIGKK